MFADPLSITINGSASSLPRTATSGNSGQFQNAARSIVQSASHSYGSKRTRRVIRVDTHEVVNNPMLTGSSIADGVSVYLVIDEPNWAQGTNNPLTMKSSDVAIGLMTQLTASTNSLLLKFAGGES